MDAIFFKNNRSVFNLTKKCFKNGKWLKNKLQEYF